MTLDWTHGALYEGLHLYRSRRFFEAHEAWESVWITAAQPEKLFLQSLIQVTVAQHHSTRDNHLGATRLLAAALRKLEPYPIDFAGLDVGLLRDDIRASLAILASNFAPAHLAPLSLAPPRIQLHSL